MKHFTLFALPLCVAATAFADNWPGWRGDGSGVSSETRLPQSWSTNENVRWHATLSGPGNSSPIVWGDRVFLTQAAKGEQRRTVMCFNRADGKLLWQSGVTYTEKEPTQESNPYCSATPVTDGARVIASFGSAGLYCYDFEGKELWHRELGKMSHMFGNASSPILCGDLCILNFGPDQKARLVAVNKKDGKTVWEAEPPKVEASEKQAPRGGPGGPGGGGGPGGRGGFGPGTFMASQMMSQADKKGDQKLTREEFVALADVWFDKLDSDKAGKLSQEQFVERISTVLAPPQGSGPPDGGPGGDEQRPGGPGGPGGGIGRFVGPGLFTAANTDKDEWLTREEFRGAFGKWFADWDADKSGALNEEKLREGLNAALPRPQFGGPGGAGGPGGPGGRGGPGGPGGPGGMMGGTWGTPLVIKVGDHQELVTTFPYRLVAYEPSAGKELWFSKGVADSFYVSPLFGEGVVVGMSSGPDGSVAVGVKPGGSGDVTEKQRAWRLEKLKSSIGSGVIYEGNLYTIGQDGTAGCFDARTGDKVWEQRLKGPGSKSSAWSSMLVADGKIYIPNQSGDVFVLRAGPKFELLATNSVNEPTNASLAVSDGDLFFRTDKGLWCLANAK
jgi:outer membrane protein assembly factor BamB